MSGARDCGSAVHDTTPRALSLHDIVTLDRIGVKFQSTLFWCVSSAKYAEGKQLFSGSPMKEFVIVCALREKRRSNPLHILSFSLRTNFVTAMVEHTENCLGQPTPAFEEVCCCYSFRLQTCSSQSTTFPQRPLLESLCLLAKWTVRHECRISVVGHEKISRTSHSRHDCLKSHLCSISTRFCRLQ